MQPAASIVCKIKINVFVSLIQLQSNVAGVEINDITMSLGSNPAVEDAPELKYTPISSNGLPFPLPYPPYSKTILEAQAEGKVLLVRAQLVRESARFYLGIKHDLSQHYNEICTHLIKVYMTKNRLL